MKISNIEYNSFIDYPDKISTVLFTKGCNFKCPTCHAKYIIYSKDILNIEKLFSFLKKRKKWMSSIVLCGGEPTIHPDIIEFIIKLKNIGYFIKLDTNGSNPDILNLLIKNKYIDYIAMDIKAPTYLYNKVCGIKVNLKAIEKSMKIISKSDNYEFRTTIVPYYFENDIRFLNEKDIINLIEWMRLIIKKDPQKYIIQKFISSKGRLLDNKMEKIKDTSEELMNKIYKSINHYFFCYKR